MDIANFANVLIKLVIAVACAGAANIFIPRSIPGKLAGMILIGMAGVILGEWSFRLLQQRFGLDFMFLDWNVQGVLIIPAIIGCAIVLYIVSTILSWWRYGI
ncbi:hypothetical protein [Egbenema bharatensis]|uniref:hypothetical protein n=1 Tax=Egbenema bharatensis TaxID=3463334 RepID=UPI003A8C16FE